ncbi:hypothetical protein E2P81_ATG01558 [Venturia nashicola]|nr:hypothetical protein E2P81_ATG01558 [Venturia nashicola]
MYQKEPVSLISSVNKLDHALKASFRHVPSIKSQDNQNRVRDFFVSKGRRLILISSNTGCSHIDINEAGYQTIEAVPEAKQAT